MTSEISANRNDIFNVNDVFICEVLYLQWHDI